MHSFFSFTILAENSFVNLRSLSQWCIQGDEGDASPTDIQQFFTHSFYRAMLCIRGTNHGPVSVCPSVTSRCSTKTAKHRITQTTLHDSTGTLVFGCQRSPRNSTGVTPCEGAKYRWGGSKSATFDKLLAISRKRYKIRA